MHISNKPYNSFLMVPAHLLINLNFIDYMRSIFPYLEPFHKCKQRPGTQVFTLCQLASPSCRFLGLTFNKSHNTVGEKIYSGLVISPAMVEFTALQFNFQDILFTDPFIEGVELIDG